MARGILKPRHEGPWLSAFATRSSKPTSLFWTTLAFARSIRWNNTGNGAKHTCRIGSAMAAFEYRQAQEIRDVFARHRVRYLFIGKSGAILLGFPDTTQDAPPLTGSAAVTSSRPTARASRGTRGSRPRTLCATPACSPRTCARRRARAGSVVCPCARTANARRASAVTTLMCFISISL